MTSLCLVLMLLAQAPASTAANAVARINAKVRVEVVAPVSPTSIAGHYTSNPAELKQRMGGNNPLQGDDLYLFPDGTYIYVEWADILPATIYDKGKWRMEQGTVALTSDRDIFWKNRAERRYVAFQRENRESEVLLIGLANALPWFEREDGAVRVRNQVIRPDPEFMLLLASRVREQQFSTDFAKVKADLMRKAWKPDFFREDQK